MFGNKLVVSNKKIMNYDEVISFIDSPAATLDDLNNLALSIEDIVLQKGFLPHDLVLADLIVVAIRDRMYTLSPDPINDLENSEASREKGVAKVMHGPGSSNRRHNPPGSSILNFPNGSILAVGVMMLNVVIVGIMYIMLIISKIGG